MSRARSSTRRRTSAGAHRGGRDTRPLVRRPRARACPRGRGHRRRVHARPGERRAPRRADLPVQGGRVRHHRRPQPRLGVASRRARGGSGRTWPGSSTSTSRPRSALRLGMALGTALQARRSRRREQPPPQPACRLVKRALLAGIYSTGVHVDDLRVMPARRQSPPPEDAGLRGRRPRPPERVRPGGRPDRHLRAARASRRRPRSRRRSRSTTRARSSAAPRTRTSGSLRYPSRAAESYADDLSRTLDVERHQERADSASRSTTRYSSASLHPAARPRRARRREDRRARLRGRPAARRTVGVEESLSRRRSGSSRPSAPTSASSWIQAAERISLVDEQGREVPLEQELLLLRVPLTEQRRDRNAGGAGDRDEPRRHARRGERGDGPPHAGLARGADEGGDGGRDDLRGRGRAEASSFRRFLPAYDAMASLCYLLQLLAPVDRPLSALVDELPQPPSSIGRSAARWALKGTVMRLLTERLKERETDLLDGIKVLSEGGWSQVIPDPDEPRRPRVRGRGDRRARPSGSKPSSRRSSRRSSSRQEAPALTSASRNPQVEVEGFGASCFTGGALGSTRRTGGHVEALPDLATLSDSGAARPDPHAARGGAGHLVSPPASCTARSTSCVPSSSCRLHKQVEEGESPLARGRSRQADRDPRRQGRAADLRGGAGGARRGGRGRDRTSHCPECGFQNLEAARYCEKCGARS